MDMTLIPTSRWVSLTLTFPGVGSVTRDRSIYKPVTVSAEIGAKLLDKFYAKLIEPVSESNLTTEVPPAETDAGSTEDTSGGHTNDPEATKVVLSPTEQALDAINACQTVEELKELGLNVAKANTVLDALPLDELELVELIPAKILASIIAKFE
jgi:hypothetical protein